MWHFISLIDHSKGFTRPIPTLRAQASGPGEELFCFLMCELCLVLMFPQAAARHHCSYLVQQHSAGFLEAGGEESWLSGLQHAPTKLRSLQTLNKLLAHRPWLITQQHIQVRHNELHVPLSSFTVIEIKLNTLHFWLTDFSLQNRHPTVYLVVSNKFTVYRRWLIIIFLCHMLQL